MPDENGKLTEDEQKEVLLWAEETFPNGVRCPMCGGEKWHPDFRLTATECMDKTGRILPGRGLSSVSIQCETCGFTASFNARHVGILPRVGDDEDAKDLLRRLADSRGGMITLRQATGSVGEKYRRDSDAAKLLVSEGLAKLSGESILQITDAGRRFRDEDAT